MYNIEEPSIDMLSYKYREMLSLWPLAFLVVPILYRADNVRFVGLPKHNLNFIHRVVAGVFQEDVQTPARRLAPFARYGFKFAKPQTGRVFENLVLQPVFVETSVSYRKRLRNFYFVGH